MQEEDWPESGPYLGGFTPMPLLEILWVYVSVEAGEV